MEVEKRGVKGGFLHLFDWNGKSRRKLFSTKSESQDSSSRLGKENYRGSFIRQTHLELEKGVFGGDGGYHNAASDSEYGAKAPGVVARLMGLDSLPSSDAHEPVFINPLLEPPHAVRDVPSYLMAAPVLSSEHDIVIFESVRNKLDGSSRNPLDMRLKKIPGSPIERFQTEGLPTRTVSRPVSMSHHRLLSPIKSPGFIPPKNAAYIIEAAAKIMEQSPRSSARGSVPSVVGSSLLLRTRDLKQRMEAAERSSRINFDKSRKAKDQTSSQIVKKENSAQRSRVKEKTTNAQRRDVSASVNSRSFVKQKEQNDAKSNGSTGNQPNPRRRVDKQSSSRSYEALRLNNQKQNRTSAECNHNPEVSCSNSKTKKNATPSTTDVHAVKNRTVDKIVASNAVASRKMSMLEANSGKRLSSSSSQASSGRKQPPPIGDVHTSGDIALESTRIKVENSGGSEKKKDMEIVSFTFTSPVKKSGVGSLSHDDRSAPLLPHSNLFGTETDARNNVAPSSGVGDIGGDALGMLLEQKLRELTSNLMLSQKELSKDSSPVKYMRRNGIKSHHHVPNTTSDDCSSVSNVGRKDEEERKAMAYGNGSYRTLQGCNSISSRSSFHGGAASGSFEVDGSSIEGRFSSVSCEEEPRKSQLTEGGGDYEISDTASSISAGNLSEVTASCSYSMNPRDPSNWQLQYIGDILKHAAVSVDEFPLKQVEKIVLPDLFDQLENHLYKDLGEAEPEVLQRRVLFDRVCEWLEFEFGDALGRSCRIWGKKRSSLTRGMRRWLGGEIHREISGWESAAEMMVDEVVEKDMSNGVGKWVEFENEAFEEGLEIERKIVSSLVDETVQDLLLPCF